MQQIARQTFVDHMVVQTPKGLIDDGLPGLNVGAANERTTTSALRDVFTGHMASWHDFNRQVSTFYTNQQLQDAFLRTNETNADLDATSVLARFAVYPTLDYTQISEENSTHSAFRQFAVNRLFKATDALFRNATTAQIRSLKAIPMTNDWAFGSVKITRKDLRAEYEPDIIFKMPHTGDRQKERLVGEMKFFGTCKIEPGWGKPNSQSRGSMRHVFGQVARDMRTRGLRFGFVSTYEETVFLKIGQQSNGSFALFYSDIVRHTDKTIMSSNQQVLASISVRLGLLYLLHRATHEDASKWSFNGNDIDEDDWICEKPNKFEGEQAAPYDTPNMGTVQGSSRQEITGDLSPSIITRGIANINISDRNPRNQLAAARVTRSKTKQDPEKRIDQPQ